MSIKKIEDLKKRQIICRYTGQIEDCLGYLKQLGFKVEKYQEKPDYLIIYYSPSGNFFSNYNGLACLKVEFYNKKLVRSLIKLIKEKEKEKKEKIEDIEFASDSRIIKVNNKESEKKVFIITNKEVEIKQLTTDCVEKLINLSFIYATQEARDKAMFKLEIETKLRNIAERLNAGRKIDWEDELQKKFEIYYDSKSKKIDDSYFSTIITQGTIYCLDKNFLEVAKKEIGEDKLIKYFTVEE